MDRLVAVHANDSKTEFASGVDRHENIGMGSMGEQAFLAVAVTLRSKTSLSFWRCRPGGQRSRQGQRGQAQTVEVTGRPCRVIMIRVSHREFEKLVLRALDGLPEQFKERLDNVDIVVDDWPSPEEIRDMA